MAEPALLEGKHHAAPGPVRALLLIVPLLVIALGWWMRHQQGPYYAGVNSDPEYVYLTNSLNLLERHAPAHTDHPGSTLQELTAAAFALRHAGRCIASHCEPMAIDILRDPETFLEAANWALLIFLGVTLLVAGRRIYRLTGSASFSMAMQAGVLLFPTVAFSLSRVNPDPLLVSLSVLFVLPFFEMAYRRITGKADAGDRHAVALGIVFGAGLITKVVFLPLGLLAMLFRSRTAVIRFTIAAVCSAMLFMLPAIGKLVYFFHYILALLTHAGRYGTGATGLPDAARLGRSAYSVLAAEPFFLLWILGLLAVAIFYPKHRALFLVPAVLSAAILAVTIKHPPERYLIAVMPLLSFWTGLLHRLTQGDAARRKLLWTAIAAAGLFTLFSGYRWIDTQRRYGGALEELRAAARQVAPICHTYYHYTSSDVDAAVIFADEWSRGQHARIFEQLYPGAVRYNSWSGAFDTFGGVDRTPQVIAELKQGKCVLLQGSIFIESVWPRKRGLTTKIIASAGGETLRLVTLDETSVPAAYERSGRQYAGQ